MALHVAVSMSKRKTIDSYWPSNSKSNDSCPEMQTAAVIHSLHALPFILYGHIPSMRGSVPLSQSCAVPCMFSNLQTPLHSWHIPNDFGDQVPCLRAPTLRCVYGSVLTFVQHVAASSDQRVTVRALLNPRKTAGFI